MRESIPAIIESDDVHVVGEAAQASEPIYAELVPRPSAGWERAVSRLTWIVGPALIASVTMLAVGYATFFRDRVNSRASKSSHPLDWMLWFGGAKDDQTVEKYIRDATEKSQREWDERYRNSPAYQLNPKNVDWSRRQFKIQPAVPTFKPAAPPAKPQRGTR